MLGELLRLRGRLDAGRGGLRGGWGTGTGFHLNIAERLGQRLQLAGCRRLLIGAALADRIADVEERVIVSGRRKCGAVFVSSGRVQ